MNADDERVLLIGSNQHQPFSIGAGEIRVHVAVVDMIRPIPIVTGALNVLSYEKISTMSSNRSCVIRAPAPLA